LLILPRERKYDYTVPQYHVHPSLLKNVTTESILKLLKFGLWVNHQLNNKSQSLKEVIKKELELYKHELPMRWKTNIKAKEPFQESITVSNYIFSI
jgi:hypothetical protein